jgi:hypothetical protein
MCRLRDGLLSEPATALKTLEMIGAPFVREGAVHHWNSAAREFRFQICELPIAPGSIKKSVFPVSTRPGRFALIGAEDRSGCGVIVSAVLVTR